MITRICALFLVPAFASAELRVHEWGTFTTLSDSSGTEMMWYSPQSEHSALPAFVKADPMFMKNTILSKVRMETPVIYFYPSEPMEVSVEAWFKEGGITEFYPAKAPNVSGQRLTMLPNGLPSMPTHWTGRLLPPDEREAITLIPAVSSGDRGEHYAAAREVPDAWIFHHRAKITNPETHEVSFHDQADKFIFYRGAGDFESGLKIGNPNGEVIHITNESRHVFTQGVLLEVRGDKARWSRMPEVVAAADEPASVSTHITGAWQSLGAAESELKDWFQSTLSAQGLTDDEAAAMIATWRGAWFRESGLRVFTIMPRTQVDEILPLNIKPEPSKMVRVFVNRHELITAAQEQELADLIHDTRIPNDEARERLRKLDLGRFQSAALERALDIGRDRMQMRYQEITSAVSR